MGKRKNQQRFDNRGGYADQAISQANSEQANTNIAMPNDENVIKAKKWVDKNHK